jgi:hypothetical protein
MDLSDANLAQRDAADRREVDPPIQVETGQVVQSRQLDWWVRERPQWFGRVRGADARQRWIKSQ